MTTKTGKRRELDNSTLIVGEFWNRCAIGQLITADTALRLVKCFAMEAQFWMNLQSHYDLEVAKDA